MGKKLTARQVARWIGAGESTVAQWCRRGLVPCHWTGGRVHLDEMEMAAWIVNSRTTQAKRARKRAGPEKVSDIRRRLDGKRAVEEERVSRELIDAVARQRRVMDDRISDIRDAVSTVQECLAWVEQSLRAMTEGADLLNMGADGEEDRRRDCNEDPDRRQRA